MDTGSSKYMQEKDATGDSVDKHYPSPQQMNLL